MPFLPFVSIITFYWQCVPCPWFLITCPAVMMPKAAGSRLSPSTETSSGEVAAIHAWVNFLWLWWIETDSDGLKLIQMDWIGFRWNETESHGLKENQIDWNRFRWFLMGSKEIRCLAFNGLDWLSRWKCYLTPVRAPYTAARSRRRKNEEANGRTRGGIEAEKGQQECVLNIVHWKSSSLPKPTAMVVRTIGSHQGLSQRRPEMILKENLHFHPFIHRIAPFSRFCKDFFVTTFADYLPKELLSPAAATRAAACAGKFY